MISVGHARLIVQRSHRIIQGHCVGGILVQLLCPYLAVLSTLWAVVSPYPVARLLQRVLAYCYQVLVQENLDHDQNRYCKG